MARRRQLQNQPLRVRQVKEGERYNEEEKADNIVGVRPSDTAKERIFSLLPPDQKEEFIALFDEFEESETPEARFAHAMDNLQPLLLNNSNNGVDWREHRNTASQIYRRQSRTKWGSESLFEYSDRIIQENIAKGNLIDDSHDQD